MIRVTPPALDAVVEAATHAETPLLWLLDAAATPAQDALDALLVHAPGPAASLPVDKRNYAYRSFRPHKNRCLFCNVCGCR